MERKKILKWFGMFLAVMFLFTLLSRAADSVNVAKVQVKSVQNQVISHKVSGSGKVEGTKERAVFTKENQRVEQVMAQEGQTVQKGDVLFVLSMEELEKTMEEKEKEVESLTRKAQDLESADTVEGTKKSLELQRAEENYDVAVSNGDINIANAQMEVDVARQKLQNYYDAGGGDVSTEQALLDDIRSREESLNQVIMTRNQEVLEAERAVEDAKTSEASDGSLKDAQQELETAQKELKELEELQKEEGKICAPADGVIKQVVTGTGGITTADAAMILYETSGTLRMTGTITKEELEYVSPGTKAVVKGSSQKEITDAVVESVKEDPTDEDLRIVSVSLPENSLNIGESAEFTITVEEGPYSACVPLSALYEENGSYYVYVMDTESSVLGEVQTARRVEVSVQDKNQQFAALGEGAVSSDQKIITDADREISEGSRVRLQES